MPPTAPTIPTPSSHGGDPDAVARELGIPTPCPLRLDFSVNLNPLGPPSAIANLLPDSLADISTYPSPTAGQAVSALAQAHAVPADTVLVGNGSTEIFSWIAQTLASSAGWIAPTYAGYAEVCRAAGIPAGTWSTRQPDAPYAAAVESLHPPPGSLLFLGTPDNPTGQSLPRELILSLAQAHPRAWIVADESFIDFLPDPAPWSLIRPDLPRNLIVVKSLTKVFAIPGLRLGMACAHPDTCARIRRAQLPWSVNALAQRAATLLYSNPAYLRHTRSETVRLRDQLQTGLSALGWHVIPSAANYLLVRLPPPWTATSLQSQLLRQGILIRSCLNVEGLGDAYIRLAVRPDPEIKDLLTTLQALKPPAAQPKTASSQPAPKPSTPAIMVVGTTSHAGKSVTAAALCRHFARQGVRVAPFKAQNMALNSFVTPEGGEMGRAQVMQARAAGIPPHTDMNPVLLKPSGNQGSQVIVNGHAVGVMNARSYYDLKQSMRKAALDAYDRLAARHALIILEGAGSPAEINLLEEDFVNMAMADYAGARVILVADIDRGGVFASIYGTVTLLPPRFRHLISGVIINKFRGDKSLLDPGIRQIEQLTGIPVLGVLPFARDLGLEDEDSLGIDDRPARPDAPLDIAVIRLPHISNYTDFLPLEQDTAVSLRYVESAAEPGTPDLIILPGTKNTRNDLAWLRQSGLADAILAAARRNIPIIGICGGYQMLGVSVADPEGVEGTPGETPGLGLLDVSTTLEQRKELAQVKGSTLSSLPFAAPGTPFTGYEIHAGRTSPSTTPAVAITIRRDTPVLETAGAVASTNSLVVGCYVHGLFDTPELRTQLIHWLLQRKGLSLTPSPASITSDPLDALADLVELHLDMTAIDKMADRLPVESRP